MPLLRLHKKSDKDAADMNHPPTQTSEAPEFRIIRSDTYTEETIDAPPFQTVESPGTSPRKSFGLFRRSIDSGRSSQDSHSPRESRFSRLHIGRRSRSGSSSSVNIPDNLPEVGDTGDEQEREAQWEKRATILVQGGSHSPASLGVQKGNRSRSSSVGKVNDPEGDETIQEAIRLHEAGGKQPHPVTARMSIALLTQPPSDLEKSTHIFGKLADPQGQNNALSQVLFGLALRHGWGCQPNTEMAVQYLSAAASNSASIEEEALRAGMVKGGAAKGELVLAIYELANCYRNGWGVAKDPAAARQYYETAANLGDTDAMNEAGWCYLEGFGGKKDKAGRTEWEQDAGEFLDLEG
ncbi:conserved hypothetical protein [Trichophyton verrucosum HKI 0517]|uniref:Cell cycle inhibitor Nif1 n=1 Tax=Trichophyton verrucosum (strain HKI 0517) TaxID=663202 RepID=D4D9H4_TRIVH|nr:uncharacterized protein TRV_03767 [Trichophyton verrucosum HKI 0517]EFE41504.1 conserved hypothetical protein [Trichophyton verrucosum HKI 0517]